MSVASSSPSVSSLPGQPLSVEALQLRLGGPLRERELLHACGRRTDLDQNRREIGATQRQLAAVLAAGYAAGV